MGEFIGRKEELKNLQNLSHRKKVSFVVVRGRRFIGKSPLIKEFRKNFETFYFFQVWHRIKRLPCMKHQLNEFSRQMLRIFNCPFAKYDDWSDVFWALAERLKKGKTLLLFDEISWMGSQDYTFLAKIKNLWDLHLM